MLVVVSPAKRLDFGVSEQKIPPSWPAWQDDAVSLSKTASRLSVAQLRQLMSISQDLAKLNQGRFRSFEPDPPVEATRPAVFAFAGDTYLGLEARSLDASELAYAQDHLRILSGLYGLLKPMDRIQPYRLEMGSRLATRRGKTLYKYWGDRLAKALSDDARQTGAAAVVNCASVEYFSAVPEAALTVPVIVPVFMEQKGDTPKIVSFFAKKARGAMARFIVQNRITDPAGLLDFDLGGYRYQPQLSTPNKPVFLRDASAEQAA